MMIPKTDMKDNKNTGQNRINYLLHLRAKLIIVGKKVKDIGRETGYDPSLVGHVLRGRRNNKKIIDYVESLPYPKPGEVN